MHWTRLLIDKVKLSAEEKQDNSESIETCISVLLHDGEKVKIMENSKTQDSKTGNTPKLSRKGTKKQNKLGSFFGKVFPRPKQQKENDKKSNNGEVNMKILLIWIIFRKTLKSSLITKIMSQ